MHQNMNQFLGSISLKKDSNLRIAFFGNHIYGYCSLYALLESGLKPEIVISNVPRADEQVWYPSVSELAEQNNIEKYCSNKISADSSVFARINDLNPDILVVSSYRNILGSYILDIAELGAINLHMAPLPRYRGAHPENWAIINGEDQMGYSVHYLDEGIDTGDIIAQDSVSILPEDDILSLTYKIAADAPKLLIKVLRDVQSGHIIRIPQDESDASYYPPRKPEDGIIDWSRDEIVIHNLVRSLTRPYPGAFTFLRGDELRIWRTRIDGDQISEVSPGTLISVEERNLKISTGTRPIVVVDFDWLGDVNIKQFVGESFE